MKNRLLNDSGDLRTFALVLDTGDEAKSCVERFAREHGVTSAQITGIGAFSDCVLCYFDWDTKQYSDNSVDEQVEVASLIGDIGEGPDGAPAIHIHLVLGRSDARALAGHLGSGHVRPTLELIVTESAAHLRRRRDPETGLNLIEL